MVAVNLVSDRNHEQQRRAVLLSRDARPSSDVK
jgi:hypothetical protein